MLKKTVIEPNAKSRRTTNKRKKADLVLTLVRFAYNIYVEAEASSGCLSEEPVIKN